MHRTAVGLVVNAGMTLIEKVEGLFDNFSPDGEEKYSDYKTADGCAVEQSEDADEEEELAAARENDNLSLQIEEEGSDGVNFEGGETGFMSDSEYGERFVDEASKYSSLLGFCDSHSASCSVRDWQKLLYQELNWSPRSQKRVKISINCHYQLTGQAGSSLYYKLMVESCAMSDCEVDGYEVSYLELSQNKILPILLQAEHFSCDSDSSTVLLRISKDM